MLTIQTCNCMLSCSFLYVVKKSQKRYHHGESERNRRIYVIGVCLCMCMYMCTYVSKRKRSTCIIQRVALKAFYNSVTSTRKGLHIKIHNNNSNIILVQHHQIMQSCGNIEYEILSIHMTHKIMDMGLNQLFACIKILTD